LPLYLLLAAFFILYIHYQGNGSLSLLFGAAILISLGSLVVLEVFNSLAEQGTKKGIMELFTTVIIIAFIWVVLTSLLGTSHPLDVVPSCSMLPVLSRGDMIIIKGVANASDIHAPMVDMSKSAMAAILQNPSLESLECVAYKVTGSGISVNQFIAPGYSIGLYRPGIDGGSIISNGSQASNPIRYLCGEQSVRLQNGTIAEEAYIRSITIGNTTITGDQNNSIIVYHTLPQDLFYREGDSYIVHRVYAIINVTGSYYFLTKGDNNPGLDMQFLNVPPNMSQVQGQVVATIPYIGYLKLAFSNQLTQPAGCNTTVIHGGA
jgi:hypothetical protein